MKLAEALKILQKPRLMAERIPFTAHLVCGFEPLHLKTFLTAQLQDRFPHYEISIMTGLYGDWLGNLNRLQTAKVDAAAVVLEWTDFDPRLGIRQLGGWKATDLEDILKTVNTKVSCFQDAIIRAAERIRLALCLPNLPLPPVSFTPPRQSSSFEIGLKESLDVFAARVACQSNVRIVNPQWLDSRSPLHSRLDVKSELAFGFPYQLSHASLVAESLGYLMCPAAPKKGLITDLDGTLWSGILGEVGVDGISWDLANGSHLHGLYQQLLNSLAEAGVLIAVASKNDMINVAKAFQRDDLILPRDRIFPIEAHWQQKSVSVSRILQAWNISADSVVYVDDSAMELAEVKAAHPAIECVLFPRRDSQAVYDLLERFKNIFGKEALTEEDGLRLESLRQARANQEEIAAGNISLDEFLKGIAAELTIDLTKQPIDARALDLINKTNQFNLNGKRYTESGWKSQLQDSQTFVLLVSYKDKYGPLGKIALLNGNFLPDQKLQIHTWVMSCRAFTRRIEHQCLKFLFTKFFAEEILFDYQETPQNGPTREFFAELLGSPVQPGCKLTRGFFFSKDLPLYHTVKEAVHE